MKIKGYKILEVILYVLGYTFTFYISSKVFKSFYLSNKLPFLYSFLSVLVIYILNKTVKPILFYLTLPISALTYGVFYFVINTIILKIVDLVMGSKVNFDSIWILFLISIFISAINLLVDLVIIRPIIKRVK